MTYRNAYNEKVVADMKQMSWDELVAANLTAKLLELDKSAYIEKYTKKFGAAPPVQP